MQEFRVSRNTSGAENGRSGGAVVNVVTKSGSNHFHGSVFDYARIAPSTPARHSWISNPLLSSSSSVLPWAGPSSATAHFSSPDSISTFFTCPQWCSSITEARRHPGAGTGPETPGDYEASDQTQVFASAAQLSQQAGLYPSKLVGNAGFAKVDFNISPRNYLSLRLNTSRYSGQNNVFLDPSSPLTTFGVSDNGEEQVATESASLSLISGISPHLVSHLRAQFSRDLQQSSSNTTVPLTKITNTIDGFGRSSILPRQTNEHRLHLAETFSLEAGRHSWKIGGDALLTTVYNFFPSLSGGEYIFDPIKVNQFTFEPQIGGLELTPLRAYAHDVPHYYVQNFGSAVTHPNTNEYSAFLQDTIRVTNHLGLSFGARYDLQTFSTKYLVSNPLWPDSGKVPFNPDNFAPRIGLAYSAGHNRPLVIRAGYGLFYTRIPQIYNSTIESENGLTGNSLFLNNTNYYDHQIFPQYPDPLVNCASTATVCTPPANLMQYVQSDMSAFAHNFRTPEVHQASLSMEREMADIS